METTRHTTTTEGKEISFKVRQPYYTPPSNDRTMFNSFYESENKKFAVSWTEIWHDKGQAPVSRFGIQVYEHYDNGYIGEQYFDFYDTKKEAEEALALKKTLTPRAPEAFKMTIGYADVFLIENNK